MADDVYQDILRKYRGNHSQARNAMRNLGLEDMIPAWAASHRVQGSHGSVRVYEDDDSFEEDARLRHLGADAHQRYQSQGAEAVQAPPTVRISLARHHKSTLAHIGHDSDVAR